MGAVSGRKRGDGRHRTREPGPAQAVHPVPTTPPGTRAAGKSPGPAGEPDGAGREARPPPVVGHPYLAMNTVSCLGCTLFSSTATSLAGVSTSCFGAWSVTASSALWNFTLTMRLTPRSCMVTP
ncbi:MAG: hypothetical protein RJA22_836 [Verrucomicrobiota bacterium]